MPIQDTINGEKVIDGVIVVTSSFEGITDTINRLTKVIIIISIGLVIAVILLSNLVAATITRPFKVFIRYAKGITEGNLVDKYVISGNYEIEQISNSFNHVMNKLGELEENRQQFVANVSHELKTPLSSIKVLSDSLLLQDNVTPELYKEFLQDF